ncbi:hypothetical protein [Streptococcus oralis]|jgi:hypothetical protein|uniref:hypothetical protein n=1 Tax=Streptococcus oralis TaxID=1303 RepID=UPI0001CC5C1C|nr:hypothetical protein [Streptococcus oralis]EFE56363.1 hypothetical protein HMPREF8579_1389 [Streptococcus oralis ATCC 35037]EFO01909.1 hypothetical protein SMSK23_1336 [Streptococcus oralis ATCC 35037]KZX04296.1 hypothetical protein A4222_02595 [Streptococcus oralis]MBS9400211.1 hypothetical protein [Streptococcus oralis]OOR77402.1 hypothetical protein B0176_08065 [Streptococcus oralis]
MEQEVVEQEQETIEINISKHDFDEAKEHLKEFAEQSQDELYFDKVRTHDDFFGFEFAEHGVTGNEFNTLVEQIQNYISKFYDNQQTFIEEFGQVYKALEALDKDYIQAILSSVAAIEHTNKKILKEQARIDKTIEKQKLTLEALKQFKEKFNEEKSKNSIVENEERLSALDDRIVNLEGTVSQLPLETVSHTAEIEELRKELKESKQQIQFISNRLLTLFIVSGVSIGMLLITLLFMFLR